MRTRLVQCFRALNRHHWPFDDPAHAVGTEEEKLEQFRRVRDEIDKTFRAYAAGRIDALNTKTKQQSI